MLTLSMEAASVHYRACCLAIGILIGTASGCCAPLTLSGRFDDVVLADDPTCAAVDAAPLPGGGFWMNPGPWDVAGGCGWFSPPYVFPYRWPNGHWPQALTRHGFRENCGKFRENYLQPEAPPLKPPHARFHPLPTQPVFAGRAEYAPPELLHPPKPELHPTTLPQPEELPLPIPVPSATEPDWRDAPRLRPPQPPAELRDSSPALLPAPQAPTQDDASRGAISPTSFEQLEPNPLRKGKISFR